MFRLIPGVPFAMPETDHLRIVFVIKGRGKCGRETYKAHTAIEFSPGEHASFSPVSPTDLLCLTIPSIVELGLKDI